MLSHLTSWLIASTFLASAFASAPDASQTSSAPIPSGSTHPSRSLPDKMYVAYWSVWAQANIIPSAEQLAGVTHVVLAFVDMKTWTGFETANPAPFSASTIASLRAVTDAKITASFGGWNLDLPFRPGATEANRATFAQNIVTFVDTFGLDGADIDWEFPVDGSQTYRLDPASPDYRGNAGGVGDADAQNFVGLMDTIRGILPEDKTLSIAVPARHVDMIAYQQPGIIAGLDRNVDYWKLMTYDFINRRDNTSSYHSGLPVVDDSYDFYLTQKGLDPKKVVIGFPMYAKWFDSATACTASPPIGCELGVAYEEANGTDTGHSGPAVWNTAINVEFTSITELNTKVASSFASLTDYTNEVGASAWFDTTNSIFWTWVSPADIAKTCNAYKSKVRGMGVWSLNQDGPGFPHLKAISDCLAS